LNGSGIFTNAHIHASDVTIGSASSQGYQFAGDTLHVTGNFLQRNGLTTATFVADATHTTSFEGTAAQTMTFASGNTSRFGNLLTVGSGGLTLAGNASLAASGGLTILDASLLTIPAAASLGMNNGKITLGLTPSGTLLLKLDGTLGFGAGQCVNTGGFHTATGTGTVNVIAGPVAPATFVDPNSGHCTTS
jgi:hypothetical protein